MIDSRMVKLVLQFVLGCGLILAAVFFLKTQSQSETLSYVVPTVQQDGTLKNNHGRMQATQRVPSADEFDNIYGRPGPKASKSRRSKSS